MCGRFAFFMPPAKLKDFFGTKNLINFQARYNAAPMQHHPIIVHNKMGLARWGYTPAWGDGDDTAMASKMINARSETVHEKVSFRESWEKKRRCLVPANGFYEWHRDLDTKANQPYYIYDRENQPLFFAGIWSSLPGLVTFSVLTKVADGGIKDLHHRMPVIIDHENVAGWFSGSHTQAREIIASATGESLSYHQVSPDVGKVSNDYEALCEPFETKILL